MNNKVNLQRREKNGRFKKGFKYQWERYGKLSVALLTMLANIFAIWLFVTIIGLLFH